MPSLNALMDSLLKEIQRCHVHVAKFQAAILWRVFARVFASASVIETRDRLRNDAAATRCVDLLKNIDRASGGERWPSRIYIKTLSSR